MKNLLLLSLSLFLLFYRVKKISTRMEFDKIMKKIQLDTIQLQYSKVLAPVAQLRAIWCSCNVWYILIPIVPIYLITVSTYYTVSCLSQAQLCSKVVTVS